MLMMDNFIHADLHPGNVLVRMEDADWIARAQRYLLIGQTGSRCVRGSGGLRAWFSCTATKLQWRTSKQLQAARDTSDCC